jgi:hypothetical protein
VDLVPLESTHGDDALVYPVRPAPSPGFLEPCLGESVTVGKVHMPVAASPIPSTERIILDLSDESFEP